jgi:hypothetical protein
MSADITALSDMEEKIETPHSDVENIRGFMLGPRDTSLTAQDSSEIPNCMKVAQSDSGRESRDSTL